MTIFGLLCTCNTAFTIVGQNKAEGRGEFGSVNLYNTIKMTFE